MESSMKSDGIFCERNYFSFPLSKPYSGEHHIGCLRSPWRTNDPVTQLSVFLSVGMAPAPVLHIATVILSIHKHSNMLGSGQKLTGGCHVDGRIGYDFPAPFPSPEAFFPHAVLLMNWWSTPGTLLLGQPSIEKGMWSEHYGLNVTRLLIIKFEKDVFIGDFFTPSLIDFPH